MKRVLLIVLVLTALTAALLYFNRGTVVTFIVDWRGLSEPFVGVTADGQLQPDLFPIVASGPSTYGVVEAAREFLASLDDAQRRETLFAVDDDEWRRWMNIHLYDRRGAGFLNMNDVQKEAGYGLLEASLSPTGYNQARDIMKLDTTLGELRGDDFEWYGEERFWLTLMGEPDHDKPWGWQIDGHHLVINYFVLGNQVVMSPVFFGAEPVIAESGRHAGTAVLQVEQDRGLAFVNMLSDEQKAVAIQTEQKTGSNNVGEFYSDNVVVPYAGIRGDELNADQRMALIGLANVFIGYLRAPHAEVKLEEVARHLSDTYFSWVGGTAPDSVFYYRIHSPVVLIEFDHQGPIGLGHLAETDGPQRNHIHVVIRTPNGNDYGKDLLRQHRQLQH